MKKTLLLAAALACSGVAQAEIYFCQTDKSVNMNRSTLVEDDNLGDFIISTSAGFKRTDQDSYLGTCETYVDKEDARFNVLACTDAGPYSVYSMTLDLVNLNFSHIQDHSGLLLASVGICTELEL